MWGRRSSVTAMADRVTENLAFRLFFFKQAGDAVHLEFSRGI